MLVYKFLALILEYIFEFRQKITVVVLHTFVIHGKKKFNGRGDHSSLLTVVAEVVWYLTHFIVFPSFVLFPLLMTPMTPV